MASAGRGRCLAWVLLCSWLAACGGKAIIDPPLDDGAGASGSSATSGSGTNSSGQVGSASGTSATSSGGPTTCEGGLTCEAGSYCDYSDDLCGQGVSASTLCVARPGNCAGLPLQYTCGCDGVVYDSICSAGQLGVDISVVELCSAPEDYFACGWTFCQLGAEYCRVVASDVSGFPDDYSCVRWPDACLAAAVPACDCMAAEPCGSDCDQAGPGRFRLLCPGG